MKKEFDLKIDGGTLESIKIDSSNSLIVATYKRDVEKFKAGDILIDAYDEDRALECISIFKEKSKIDDDRFSAFIVFEICRDRFRLEIEDWDEIKNNRLAAEEEKQLLFDALKKEGLKWNAEKLEIEKLDISDIVVDLKTAIDYLDCPRYTYNIDKKDKRLNKFEAQIKLQLIAEAWNKFDEFEADWESLDQYKHFPLFKVEDGKIALLCVSFVIRSLNPHTPNFSFKTEERAKQFGEQFIDLFKVALGI